MIIPYVFGGIIAIIALVLSIPASVCFDYESNVMKASARFLFFKINFSPEEIEKKAGRKAKKKVETEFDEQKENEKTKPDKLHSVIDTVKTIWSIIQDARWGLKLIRRNLTFYRVKIMLSVAGNDAREAADNYGKMCAAVFPAIGVVRGFFKLKEPYIYIAPDFLSSKSVYFISFRVRLIPAVVIVAIIDFFIKYLRSKSLNSKKRQEIKGAVKRSGKIVK